MKSTRETQDVINQITSDLIAPPPGGASLSQSFEIEEPVDWLMVRTVYEQVAGFGWLIILLWDPQGALRLQYMRKDDHQHDSASVESNPRSSDFGTLPGVLSPGPWSVEVIVPPHEAAFSFHYQVAWGRNRLAANKRPGEQRMIWATSEGNRLPLSYDDFPWRKPYQTRTGWYGGDCHLHTLYSDGTMSVPEVTQEARRTGLDFVVVTDHNFYHTAWHDDDSLVIPGIEITSSRGHCNLLGVRHWIDWRPSSPDGGCETQQGMIRILHQARRMGALCSLNHPFLAPWDWQYENTPVNLFDTLEIWNSPNYPASSKATEQALRLWSTLWNDGHTLWGIGGSDTHASPAMQLCSQLTASHTPTSIGDPVSRVFARNLSAQAVLEGISRGHVMINRQSIVEADVEVNGCRYPPGTDLNPLIGETSFGTTKVEFRVRARSTPEPFRLSLIQDGKPVEQGIINDGEEVGVEIPWPVDRWTWARLELRDRSGNLAAVSNPVYSGHKTPTLYLWQEVIRRLKG